MIIVIGIAAFLAGFVTGVVFLVVYDFEGSIHEIERDMRLEELERKVYEK